MVDTRKEKAVLLLSGGLDSTTLLYTLLNEGKEVTALSFNYGQKASKELKCAKNICKQKKVEHHIFDISGIIETLNYSSLIDEDNTSLEAPQNTVVPSRNTILIELATAYAISNNCDKVYYAAHQGDVNDYPDCRPIFLEKINQVNQVNNYKYIPVDAPFINGDKSEVVKAALKLNVPIEKTWSCYINEDEPCGKCFSCVTRNEAILKAKKELGME